MHRVSRANKLANRKGYAAFLCALSGRATISIRFAGLDCRFRDNVSREGGIRDLLCHAPQKR